MRMIAILSLALCTCVAACAPPQSAGSAAVKADTALTHAEQAYADAKLMADVLTPALPDAQVARIRAAEVIVERALAAARLAVTVAEQLLHVREAQAATAQIEAATGG